MYNHDLAGWRYNPAEKALGAGNVGKLVEKWRFPAADSKEQIGVVHATPAVVEGEVYFGTATAPAFYKLDKGGKQLWVYRNPDRRTVLPQTGEFVGLQVGDRDDFEDLDGCAGHRQMRVTLQDGSDLIGRAGLKDRVAGYPVGARGPGADVGRMRER